MSDFTRPPIPERQSSKRPESRQRPETPQRPSIPERYSSLLAVPCKNDLASLKTRSSSLASLVSQSSSTEEFIDRQYQKVKTEVEYTEKLMKGLQAARDDGFLTDELYEEAMKDANSHYVSSQQERVLLERQHKIVSEDLDDTLPSYATLEDAYASVIVHKTMSAQGKTKKQKWDASQFKAVVLTYYAAGRRVLARPDQAYDEAYCLLTGWDDSKASKAAHIVPRALQSDKISYLFGVGEAVLSDPRNALLLRRTIAGAFDSGLIVFVPVRKNIPGGGEETNWKCVLTDKAAGPKMVSQGTWWRDVDGKQLRFLTLARPARRFLYFRFTITYLHCKQEGNSSWVDEVESKGMIWATPGPYLRRSMLLALARKVSDSYLPELFREENTFETANRSPSRSKDEEEALVESLALRLKVERHGDSNESESDED